MIAANNCNVSIRNCTFFDFPTNAIQCNSSAKVDVMNCSFIDVMAPIWRSNNGETVIKKCLFKRCGNVERSNWCYHPIALYEEGIQSRLKCIGNMFDDCLTHPIVEMKHFGNASYRVVELKNNDPYILKK